MADITTPGIASVATVQEEVAALNAEVERLLSKEEMALTGADAVATAMNKAVGLSNSRVGIEEVLTDKTMGEVAALERAVVLKQQLLDLTNAQAAAEERVLSAQRSGGAVVAGESSKSRNQRYASEQAQLGALVESQKAARTARVDSYFGGGGGGGGSRPTAAASPEEDPRSAGLVSGIVKNQASAERDLSGVFNLEAANVSSLNTQMTRHGYLASEAIQAATKGELTYREWGSQILGTAAKFGAWTAVSIPIFGAIDAFKHLYDGAIQTSQGIAFMKRSIDGLNTGQATSEMDKLATHFNLPINDVATAIGTMGRVFHNQAEATAAAAQSLYAVKLGEIDVGTATTQLTAIINAFKLPADQLPDVFNLINQAQLRFGTSIQNSMNALSTAGGVWKAAGGNLQQLLDLYVVANRVTYVSGASFGTALAMSSSMVNQPKYVAALQQFGLVERNNNYAKLISDATKYVDKNPEQAAAVARAFGSAKQTRSLQAIFENPELRAKVENVVNPSAAKGASEAELQKQLSGASELIQKIGVQLEILGSKMADSGLLTGFGLLLHTVDALLVDLNAVAGVFDKLPGPIKEGASLMLEFAIATKAARAVNLGQGLAGSTWVGSGAVKGWLSPSMENVGAKELSKQAQAEYDLRAETARKAAQRSVEVTQQREMAEARYNNSFTNFTGVSPVGMSAEQQGAYAQKLTVEQQATLEAQSRMADKLRMADADTTEISALAKDSEVQWADYNVAMKEASGFAEKLAVATGMYGDRMTAIYAAGLGTNNGIVSKYGLGSSAAGAAAQDVNVARINGMVANGTTDGTMGTTIIANKAPMSLEEARMTAGTAGATENMLAGGAGMDVLGVGALSGAVSGLRDKVGEMSFGGAGMAALMGAMVPSMLGSMLPGALGKNVSGLGAGVGLGAGLGMFMGNPILGALLGGGAQELIGGLSGLFPDQKISQATKDALSGKVNGGFAAFGREAIAANAVGAGNPYPWRGIYEGSASTSPGQAQNADLIRHYSQGMIASQNEALKRGGPVPYLDAAQQATHGSAMITSAKTHADAVADLQHYEDQIKLSFQAMNGNVPAVKAALSQVRAAYANAFGASSNPVDFQAYYKSLGTTGQKSYNQLFTDTVENKGVSNLDVSHALGMVRYNTGQSNYWEKQAQGTSNLTDRAKFNQYADAQLQEAQKTVQSVLDGVNKDLQDSLLYATDPAKIGQAYQKAISQLKGLHGAGGQQTAAALRTDQQAYASAMNSYLESKLSVTTAENPNATFDAQATIKELGGEVQRDIKAFGAKNATTLQAIAAMNGQESTLLQDQLTTISNAGALSSALAGNNQAQGDEALLAAANKALALLKSNPKATYGQLQQAETAVAQARTTLMNDAMSQANDITTAYQTYIGNKSGNPVAAAQHALKAAQIAAQRVKAEGSAAKPGAVYTALNAVNQARQSYYAAQYSNLQIDADLSRASTSQQIGMYANFLKTIKGDYQLKQQIKEQILGLENQGSSFELNVGNVHLPSLYEVRRAELRRSGKAVGSYANYVHIAVTVGDNGNAAATGREVGRHVHKAVKTALKSSQRSSVQR